MPRYSVPGDLEITIIIIIIINITDISSINKYR